MAVQSWFVSHGPSRFWLFWGSTVYCRQIARVASSLNNFPLPFYRTPRNKNHNHTVIAKAIVFSISIEFAMVAGYRRTEPDHSEAANHSPSYLLCALMDTYDSEQGRRISSSCKTIIATMYILLDKILRIFQQCDHYVTHWWDEYLFAYCFSFYRFVWVSTIMTSPLEKYWL